MTLQNILGKNPVSWGYSLPVAISATRTLAPADILSENIYVISTPALIRLDIGTAATLLAAMQAVRPAIVGNYITLRVFNDSQYPVIITNTTDTSNFVVLGLSGGNSCVIPPSSGIDLQFNVASLSPAKFFVSGFQTLNGTQIIQNSGSNIKTLALTDSFTMQTWSNTGYLTVTIPQNVNVPFPVGTRIDFATTGTGQIGLVGDTNVNLNSSVGSLPKSSGPYTIISVMKIFTTDSWIAFGGLTA